MKFPGNLLPAQEIAMPTTLPERPTRLQQLQAQAAAITWLWLVPQPGGIDAAEYERRMVPVHAAIAEELECERECQAAA